MRKVAEGLFIGGQDECLDGTSELVVVHACKDPCHTNEVGKVVKENPKYLSARDYYNLYLNIIDPPIPLFRVEIFNIFLSFMGEQRRDPNQWILIHCNQGFSRAPSLALLYLGKRKWGSSTFEEARSTFERIYPEYNPGLGIESFLSDHWGDIE
jgi:hypothetical protein